MVFEQANAGVEEDRIQRARRIHLHRVVRHALQQQGHPHAAPGGVDQRLAETPSRKEIRVGEHDLRARAGDRLEVGLLDRVAMAQVVAHHEGGADRARNLGARRRQQRLGRAPAKAGPRHQPPQALCRGDDGREHRPLDAHRVVVARVRQRAGVEVVHHIDATDEGDAAIDRDHLAVQPAQAMAAQRQRAQFAAVDQHLHAGLAQARHQRGDEAAPAEAIHHHPHRHPAPCRARERRGDARAGAVVLEDVALQEDLALGTVDLGFQRREVLLAVLQQRDRVAREELHQPMGSRSAVSAAWSEICAHGAP